MAEEKKTNRKIIVLIIILIAAMSALIAMEYNNTVSSSAVSQSGNQVVKSIQFEPASKADFYTYNSNIYYCTKDGMQMLNSVGDVLWNDTYTMSNPFMVYDLGIVAVSEPKGHLVRVYNDKGQMYSVDVSLEVIGIYVNTSGYLSIISSSENEYQLNVYNNLGNSIFFGSFQSDDGIPVTADISDDNKMIAVGFISINDIKMQSKVLFYDMSLSENSNIETGDTMFASFIKEDEMIAVVSFLKNNSVIAVSDKRILCVEVGSGIKEKYKEKWAVELKNKISRLAFSDKQYTVIAYGEPFINSTDILESGTVNWYDINGNKEAEIVTGKKITGLYTYDKYIIVGMDRKFWAYNKNGTSIWQYNAFQDVKKVLFVEPDDTILFVGTNSADIIRLDEFMPEETEFVSPEQEENESESVLETTTQSDDSFKTSENVTEDVTDKTSKISDQDSSNSVTSNKTNKANIIPEATNKNSKSLNTGKNSSVNTPSTDVNVNSEKITNSDEVVKPDEKSTVIQEQGGSDTVDNENSPDNSNQKPESLQNQTAPSQPIQNGEPQNSGNVPVKSDDEAPVMPE